MSLVLSICVLLILLMESINGALFLNSTCILLLPPPAANSGTFVVPLTSRYASL